MRALARMIGLVVGWPLVAVLYVLAELLGFLRVAVSAGGDHAWIRLGVGTASDSPFGFVSPRGGPRASASSKPPRKRIRGSGCAAEPGWEVVEVGKDDGVRTERNTATGIVRLVNAATGKVIASDLQQLEATK